MPRSLRMKLGIVTILSLVVSSASLAFWERFDRRELQTDRSIASDLRIQRAMGKHMSVLTAQIDNSTRVPEYENQEMMITGYVTLNKQVAGDVHFEWSLPHGVTLVSGDLKGSWSEMRAGQTATAVIYVTGFSKEAAKHIIFQTSTQHGNDQLGHSALISSRPEDSLEYVAPEIRDHVEKVHAKQFPRGRIVK